MIITQTPYRIPLAGGGTDLDFYYKKRGGLLISATFNQSVITLVLKRQVDNKILIQTTTSKFYKDVTRVKHKLIREVLNYFKVKNKIQVSHFATLPTSTGLGSSSSLIVGLVNGIAQLKNIKLSKKKIAQIAYWIERKKLKLLGGWQDQIISTYGGIQKIKIFKNGEFSVKKINIKKNILSKLEKQMLLVFTGQTRNSSKMIKQQRNNSKKIIDIYDQLKSYVKDVEKALILGDYKKIGKIFHKHWQLKKQISSSITNTRLDNIYSNLLKEKSFLGGKLIGAGGGGFYLMITDNYNPASRIKKIHKII